MTQLQWWERRVEGVVGRMIDWLGDDPLRREVGPPPPRRADAATVDAVIESPNEAEAEAPSATKTEAPIEPAAESEARVETKKEETKTEAPTEMKAEAAEDQEDELDQLILRLLGEAEHGAAMRELVDATGANRGRLRTVLKSLIGSGHVRRIGAGLTTRYEIAESSVSESPTPS